MSISIYDNFNNAVGAFPNYDTFDSGQRTQLGLQKHVDIRSFIPATETRGYTMFDLDGQTMPTMDATTMQQLEANFALQPNEAWTAGTVGSQSDRNHFYGISLTCGVGSTSTQSVMSTTIDISSFGGSDYISLALPAFPQASLTLASTYLDLSSNGLTTACSLPFSSATLIANGSDYEARFPISLVTGINLAQINAVRFRITATGSCTFRCLAIRAIASTWKYAPMDQNTLFGFMGATVPPTGGTSQTYTFPTATGGVTPSNWPVLFRSDGTTGPLMVDTDVGVAIHAGSGTQQNTLSFYLREYPMTWRSMSQMETMTMAQLEALQQMPDWTPGTQDNFSQSQSLQVTLKWGTTNQLTITDTISAQTFTYTTPALVAAQDYYLLVQLQGDSLRVRIYTSDYAGNVNWSNLMFDSTAIVDSTFNRRRRGRFGWYANIGDGDCWIRQLRPRRIVYGEYRSGSLPSNTPVVGAQIFASATPASQLAGTPVAYRGAKVTPDTTKSQSGYCWAVQCTGSMLQGVQIGAGGLTPMTFSNLFDSFVSFDMLSPQATQLMALLRGDNRIIVLFQTVFQPNAWTHIDIPLDQVAQTVIPGDYYLFLVQPNAVANTFYIDNLSVTSQTVSWQGRAPAPDPWKLNEVDWVKYGNKINDANNGAILGRGNTLQIRGQVVDQSGSVDRVKILPKYATLGNLVWSDRAPNYGTPPTAKIVSLSTSSLIVTVKGDGSLGSTFPNGKGQFVWRFGDGTYAYGGTATHTYQAAGTYPITLTVIDALGQKNTVSTTVTVTPGAVSLQAVPGVVDAVGFPPSVRGGINVPAAQANASAPPPALTFPGMAIFSVPAPTPRITLSAPTARVNASGSAPTLTQKPIPPITMRAKGNTPIPKLAYAGVAGKVNASLPAPVLILNYFITAPQANASFPAPTISIH